MTDFINPIAEIDKPDSGKLITPTEAYKLRDECKFFCPDHDCQDKEERKLIVKKSVKGKFFFSHLPNCEHDIRPETLLHKAAINWFVDKVEYELPEYDFGGKRFKKQNSKLDQLRTECEFRKLQRIIPDVKLTTQNEFQFAIEIVVTNDISEQKSKLIEEFKLPTIRVTLSEFYEKNKKACQEDYEFIQNHLGALMTDINLKTWVLPPPFELVKDKFEIETINDGCLYILTGVGIILFLKRLIK